MPREKALNELSFEPNYEKIDRGKRKFYFISMHFQSKNGLKWFQKGSFYEVKFSLDGFFVSIAQMKALLMLYFMVLLVFMVTRKKHYHWRKGLCMFY